jgi:hypothetical protein
MHAGQRSTASCNKTCRRYFTVHLQALDGGPIDGDASRILHSQPHARHCNNAASAYCGQHPYLCAISAPYKWHGHIAESCSASADSGGGEAYGVTVSSAGSGSNTVVLGAPQRPVALAWIVPIYGAQLAVSHAICASVQSAALLATMSLTFLKGNNHQARCEPSNRYSEAWFARRMYDWCQICVWCSVLVENQTNM